MFQAAQHHLDLLGCELLAVVQTGTRAPVAFCAVTGGSGWISDDGAMSEMSARALSGIRAAAPAEGVGECRSELRAGHDRLLVASFEVQGLRVCAGVARHLDDPAFTPADVDRLRDLAPLAAQLGALRTQCFELERRDLVLRALRNLNDACCVLDLEARRVRWTYDLRDDRPCAHDIYSEEASFVALVEQFHAATSSGEQPPYGAVIGRTAIVRTADLGRPSEFDGAPCLAVALGHFDGDTARLSARERQIAQLLASGYSTVNAAAILSLSENTIRTYVRRLYRKLDISNRADLTRKYAELCLGAL